MSTRVETFARDRQALLDRSAHSRLQLRHAASDVRNALQWTRLATSAAPSVARLVGGIGLAAVAARPMARFVALATRALLFTKILRSLIGIARAGMGRA
jgi:hypothetical protein